MGYQGFLDHIEGVAKIIETWQNPIQILYKDNADAVIAGSLLARAFLDLETPFILTKFEESLLPEIIKREGYLTITLGIGVEEVTKISTDNMIVVLDYGEADVKKGMKVSLINPTEFGFQKNEYSVAAAAYFLISPYAVSLDYIVQLPLISAQIINMMEDYVGLHSLIAEDATTGEKIKIAKSISFLGTEIFNINDSILYSLTPFLPGLTGNDKKIIQFITQAGIEIKSGTDDRKISNLSPDEIKDLNSKLVVHLALHKGYQEDELIFIKNKTEFLDEKSGTILKNVWDIASAVNDAVMRGKHNYAIAVLTGNRTNYLSKLTKLYIEERKAVSISFQFLLDHNDEVVELTTLRYFISDHKISWYNVSHTAAMGLSNGLVTSDLPFAVVAPGPNKLHTIGIRASKSHNIGGGMSELMQEVISERKIDGEVIGSKLDSMVSVPKDLVEDILLDLNEKLRGYVNDS